MNNDKKELLRLILDSLQKSGNRKPKEKYIKAQPTPAGTQKVYVKDKTKDGEIVDLTKDFVKQDDKGRFTPATQDDINIKKHKQKEQVELDSEQMVSIQKLFNKLQKQSKLNVQTVKKAKIALNQVIATLTKLAKDQDNPNKQDILKSKNTFQKLLKGERLSQSELNLMNSYIRRSETTQANPNAVKFYVTKSPGNFSVSNIERVFMGSRTAKGVVFGTIGNALEKNGLKTLRRKPFGGKRTTASQMFVGKDNKTKLLDANVKVNKDDDGAITNLTIGKQKIVKLDPNKQGITNQQRKKIKRHNRNLENYAKQMQSGNLKFIDTDQGIVPDNPQNRQIVIKSTLSGIYKSLNKLAKQARVADENTLDIINRFNSIAQVSPNEQPQKWFRKLEQMCSQLANHTGEPPLKDAWPNLAQIIISIKHMQGQGKGTEYGKCVLMPQSPTLKNVDLIILDHEQSTRNVVTIGGQSIKVGKGGASSTYAKIQTSQFKNDEDGTFKLSLMKISNSYSEIYTIGIDEVNLEQYEQKQKQYHQKLYSRVKKEGVESKLLQAFQKDIITKGSGAYESINSALNTILESRKKFKMSVDKHIQQKLKLSLQNYYRCLYMTSYLYNTNIDGQDFVNNSVSATVKDGGNKALVEQKRLKFNTSDGFETIAFLNPTFNVGFRPNGNPNNPVTTRYVNKKRNEFANSSLDMRSKYLGVKDKKIEQVILHTVQEQLKD